MAVSGVGHVAAIVAHQQFILADRDYIYAALESAAAGIYRWQIGVSAGWTRIHDALGSSKVAYGIGMEGGALYLSTANGSGSTVYRTLGPSASPTAYVSWSELDSSANFTAEPQGLRLSSGSAKLWAISDTGVASSLYSYSDTLLGVAPTLTAPSSGSVVGVNPVTGYTQDIVFSWEKPSDEVTAYDLKIYDADGNQVKAIAVSSPSPTPSQVVGKDVTDGQFSFMPGETYTWKVRVSSAGPIYSGYSEVRSLTIGEAEVTPPVQVTTTPAPEITVTVPDIVVEVPPTVEVPAATPITPGWIYAIIAVGAILVIAVIILIVRTRRAV